MFGGFFALYAVDLGHCCPFACKNLYLTFLSLLVSSSSLENLDWHVEGPKATKLEFEYLTYFLTWHSGEDFSLNLVSSSYMITCNSQHHFNKRHFALLSQRALFLRFKLNLYHNDVFLFKIHVDTLVTSLLQFICYYPSIY